MSGLREKIADAIAGAVSQDDRYLEHADAVLRVLAEHGDTQQVREQIKAEVAGEFKYIWTDYPKALDLLAKAETDLAAARQQLELIRLIVLDPQFPDIKPDGAVMAKLRRILDTPARPAGHDESGQ